MFLLRKWEQQLRKKYFKLKGNKSSNSVLNESCLINDIKIILRSKFAHTIHKYH